MPSFLGFVREHVPHGSRVLEIGCGDGALARELDADGYDVLAIDPVAPEGTIFRQVAFEDFDEPGPFAAVVASSSLHHVGDLAVVLDRVLALLEPGGRIVVSEFAWERLDEATADWLHGQRRALAAALGRNVPGSVGELRAAWEEEHRGLHTGEAVLRALDERFRRIEFAWEPYLYRELESPASEALERTLVDAGAIQGVGFRYAGEPRERGGPGGGIPPKR